MLIRSATRSWFGICAVNCRSTSSLGEDPAVAGDKGLTRDEDTFDHVADRRTVRRA